MLRTLTVACAVATIVPATVNGYVMPQKSADFVVSIENVSPSRTMKNGCTFYEYGPWVLNCVGLGITEVSCDRCMLLSAAPPQPLDFCVHLIRTGG